MALVGDDLDDYFDSPTFRELIDTMTALTLDLVDDAAQMSAVEQRFLTLLAARVEAGGTVPEEHREAATPLTRVWLRCREAIAAGHEETFGLGGGLHRTSG